MCIIKPLLSFVSGFSMCGQLESRTVSIQSSISPCHPQQSLGLLFSNTTYHSGTYVRMIGQHLNYDFNNDDDLLHRLNWRYHFHIRYSWSCCHTQQYKKLDLVHVTVTQQGVQNNKCHFISFTLYFVFYIAFFYFISNNINVRKCFECDHIVLQLLFQREIIYGILYIYIVVEEREVRLYKFQLILYGTAESMFFNLPGGLFF